jgi:hypothetical protein
MLAVAAGLMAAPAISREVHRADDGAWIIACKLTIIYTDLKNTAAEMQQELDEALDGELCRKAVAEISLADRLRIIRARIKELRIEEEDEFTAADVGQAWTTLR